MTCAGDLRDHRRRTRSGSGRARARVTRTRPGESTAPLSGWRAKALSRCAEGGNGGAVDLRDVNPPVEVVRHTVGTGDELAVPRLDHTHRYPVVGSEGAQKLAQRLIGSATEEGGSRPVSRRGWDSRQPALA